MSSYCMLCFYQSDSLFVVVGFFFFLPNLFVLSFQPDDVEGKIREVIPAGFTCNTDDFISLLEKEANFKPFGTLLHSYTFHSEEAGELTYQIHKVQTSTVSYFCYHLELNTLTLVF